MKSKTLVYICIATTLSLNLWHCAEITSGGLTDPDGTGLLGIVVSKEGGPQENTLLILGSLSEEESFDSAWSNSNGQFVFSEVSPGDYVLLADNQEHMGLSHVTVSEDSSTLIYVLLDKPGSIALNNEMVENNMQIESAHIAGTELKAQKDDEENLMFSRAPSGSFEIIIYDSEGVRYEFLYQSDGSGCEAYIIFDPNLEPEQWTAGGCPEKNPEDEPNIIWTSPPRGAMGAIARSHYSKNYDMALQFSHTMNTRLTTNAISSGDTSELEISFMQWQGADVLFLKFCEKHANGLCIGLSDNYQIGKKYSVIIDTLAESTFGVPFAAPETLWYMPEPFPRIKKVEGFQFQASGSFEMVDSLPDSISLGDKVSPSVAAATKNMLRLYHNRGTILQESLDEGITCFANSEDVACNKNIRTGYIELIFADLFKSGADYNVIIDTNLKFNELPYPRTQSILWKTIDFTIDTAQYFGNVMTEDKISLVKYYPRQWSPITPNLEMTLFYASTLLDPASVADNVLMTPEFNRGELIIQDNVFGWEPQGWLPPDTKIKFTVLPGLKSGAGDSLGDTLRYSVTTAPFDYVHYNFFGIEPTYSFYGERFEPDQDSIYQLNNGGLFLKNNRHYQYIMRPGPAAYINLNVPVDSQEFVEQFSITPDLNYSNHYIGTGLMHATPNPLISDTIYTVQVNSALADTFGNELARPLEYKYQTEPFELKVGNLFGAYFGPIFQEDLTRLLPGQLLPQIDTIAQGVIVNVQKIPGNSLTWVNPIGVADNYTVSYIDAVYGVTLDSNVYITATITFGQNRIISNPIGIHVTKFHPGFSDSTNYMCFSHIPDRTQYRQYIEFTPDDGSIEVDLVGNMIKFSANTFAKPNSNYRIKIKEGMPDIHGRELADSVIVAFTTPVFSLVQAGVNKQIIPRDSLMVNNSLGTWGTESFSFNFMTTHSLSLPTLDKNIVITPSIPGVISANIRNVEIIARNNLMPGTNYQIDINSGLQSNSGIELDTSYTLTFDTEHFQLMTNIVGDTTKPYALGVLTNSKIDVADLNSVISISPEIYATGTFTSTEDSSGFFYMPDSTPVIGNKITAIIAPEFTDSYQNTLDSTDTLSFYWMKQFTVLDFSIGNTSNQSLFNVSTSMMLDTGSLAGAFDISMKKYQGGEFEMTPDSSGIIYHPPVPPALGDEVRVILNTNLRDVYGNNIEVPDTLDFLITSWEWEQDGL